MLSVGRFKTEEEAIALANDTTYGLGAGLHSSDANQCMRVSGALEAGTVWVNQYNVLHNNVPFGGKHQSGIGEYCPTLPGGDLIAYMALTLYIRSRTWQLRSGRVYLSQSRALEFRRKVGLAFVKNYRHFYSFTQAFELR